MKFQNLCSFLFSSNNKNCLTYSRTAIFFPFSDYLNTCSVCNLVQLHLDCGQISKKQRILKCGAYQREVLIRGRRLFWSKCQWCGACLRSGVSQRKYGMYIFHQRLTTCNKDIQFNLIQRRPRPLQYYYPSIRGKQQTFFIKPNQKISI